MRETLKQIKLPVLYTFARSGGTLINRCLGCIPGNIILSEVNPHASLVPIEVQARDWFKLVSSGDFSDFSKKKYVEKIRLLVEVARQQNSHLIIRDWTTINFLDNASDDIYAPSMVLEQELYLEQSGFTISPVVLARRSADVYESLTRTFKHLRKLPIKEFGICYLAYVQKISKYPLFHYENFCRKPEKELTRMCDVLNINYSDNFVNDFSKFTYCTGDNTLSKPSRGGKIRTIAVMESNQGAESYIAASLDKNCQQADQLLGYENMEIEKQVDAFWRIVEVRDQALTKANDLKYQTQVELERSHSQLQQNQAELERSHSQLQQNQAELERSQSQLLQSEADRAARLIVIEQLSEQLQQSEADRVARLTVIEQLSEQLQRSEADRAARLTVIEQLSEQLQRSEADRLILFKNIERLSRWLRKLIKLK
ncbi:hypothetical protein NDI44_14090 [Trichocoleus sp. DQ-A3]|uniref:hypothetical protein n=1 Tax=Cyanophyceae TaxID=3028117 RepID=UPI001687540A|nr:hypothetical protein [Coleofasciculus sp. FACHB-125]MBD1898786.1 hypothetical protein [Coleofasciculus sp. FACHB-125]